jgi:pimeloyl-ACP methyl ester carboxylesterase
MRRAITAGMKTAEAVLLLHCSGSSGAQWRSLAAKLAERYRVLTPDLIGYGANAPWAGDWAFSLADEAAPLRALVGRLGEPVHLVGHSYGGGVALHLARTRPEFFQSLTLIEPSAFHLLRDGDPADAAALAEITGVAVQAKVALANGDYLAGIGRFVDYWSGPGAWEAMAPERRTLYAPQLAKVALEFNALFSEPVAAEDLRGVALPTLLVQGARTKLPSRCVVKRLREVLPNAGFRLVEGAGHMLPITHRDAVDALVAAHLAANARDQREAA